MGFVHLHLHTEYSLLDGAIRLKDLFPKAREYGYQAVAITDHGNMYGALNFYKKAISYQIKPIIGCELYVAPGSRKDKSTTNARESAYHLVLLAKDMQGYKNLLRLTSLAYLEGFYYKPRVDLELLKEFNQGLIALSACLHGQVPHAIVKGDIKEAKRLAEAYARIFEGRFYLEIQENGIREQRLANEGLMDIAKELGLPLVATNDCHYLGPEDTRSHDVLLCIQTNKTMDDPKRMRFSTDKIYFASQEEMKERFHYIPEAISASLEIADLCNVELETGKHHFPAFPLKSGMTYEELFEEMSRKGLEKRLKSAGLSQEDEKIYRKRLEDEMEVIKGKGFSSYFLIVSDFINWAKSKNIPVGPGRGSAAGSLVSYSLGITDIDPVKYGLFFERFLNPERTSLPDIDVDFCMKRRDEVLKYVEEKYGGHEFVAQIITFGQMKARAVIRDVGRALGIPYQEVDKIAKLVPLQAKNLKYAMGKEPKLVSIQDEDPRMAQLMEIALSLEGMPRHSSTHAGGVVISDRPMMEYLPLARGQNGETLTQFDMKGVEEIGLIKFDCLGLKTLTVIKETLRLIKKHLNKDVDISSIPMDDQATFELLSLGDTTGVFQFESHGMKELLRRSRPASFTDLMALVALYRPGPLDSGMVDVFVRVKHGEAEPTYLLPELEPILKETYGVILYQEQVMQIAQKIAGYTLGEGDILRKAMGKKKYDVMAAQKERFINGAVERGVPEKKVVELFEQIEKFAGYGFNKSHSAAYAYLAYQTAWLKTHYRLSFLASLLTNELGNTDGVIKFINECRETGEIILPPDINASSLDFTIEGDSIRFGLVAVKNLGESAIQIILDEREKNGPFSSFENFCTRVNLHKVNKRVIESLIKCGAFDSLERKRSQLIEVLETALQLAQAKSKASSMGQMGLFDNYMKGEKGNSQDIHIKYPDIQEWPQTELLAREKEALGFYLSAHPLDAYMDRLSKMTPVNTSSMNIPDNYLVGLGGMIKEKKVITTKKGEPMAFLTLEDKEGLIEVVCFPEVYARVGHLLNKDEVVWVEGTYKKALEEKAMNKILAREIELLETVCKKKAKGIKINIKGEEVGPGILSPLKELLEGRKGEYPVTLNISIPGKGDVLLSLPDEYNLDIDRKVVKDVRKLFRYSAISVDYEMMHPVMEERKERWRQQ